MSASLNHLALLLGLALALVTVLQGWRHIRRHAAGA